MERSLKIRTLDRKSALDFDFKKISLVVLTIIMAVFLVVPIMYLFIQAFMNKSGEFIGLANFNEYLKSPALLKSLLNTLVVSISSTSIAVFLALIYAYALTRCNLPFKSAFKWIAMLPLFAPTMMHGIGLVYLLGKKGVITQALGVSIPLYGPLGIILAQIIYVFPQVFLILHVALSSTDYRLYEASRSFGTSKLKELMYLTLPSIKYALISSFFVAFTLCFTDFGAPKVVGGNFNVLSVDVYKQIVGQQNMPMGATVGILLIIPALVSFFITQRVQKKQSSYITSKSVPYVVKPKVKRDIVMGSIVIGISGAILLVLLAVLLASFISVWPYDLSFTLKHFQMKSSIDGLKPFLNSITISLLTALLGTVFVFLLAYLTEKVDGMKRVKGISHFLSIVPMALPGLVLGISYVTFFNNPEFKLGENLFLSNPFNIIYGTMFIMIACNIVHFYSVPFITATTAIKKIDKELDLVAKSIGVKTVSIIKNITLPLCLPAVLENFMYFFLNSMVTVSALVFLYTANLKVASISIVQLEDKGNTAEAAALAVLIVLTNIIVKIIYELIKNRLSKKYYVC